LAREVAPQFAAHVAAIVDKVRAVAIADGVLVNGKGRDRDDVSRALGIEETPGSRVDGAELVSSADVNAGLLVESFSLNADRRGVLLVPSPFSLVMMSPSALVDVMPLGRTLGFGSARSSLARTHASTRKCSWSTP